MQHWWRTRQDLLVHLKLLPLRENIHVNNRTTKLNGMLMERNVNKFINLDLLCCCPCTLCLNSFNSCLSFAHLSASPLGHSFLSIYLHLYVYRPFRHECSITQCMLRPIIWLCLLLWHFFCCFYKTINIDDNDDDDQGLSVLNLNLFIIIVIVISVCFPI